MHFRSAKCVSQKQKQFSKQRIAVPAKNAFVLDSPIGDAEIETNTSNSPSWKVVSIQSKIDNVTEVDATNNSNITQINITALYTKKVVEPCEVRENKA